MKGGGQGCDRALVAQGGVLAARGTHNGIRVAPDFLSVPHFFQTFLAEDVVALQDLGLRVDLQANGTLQLVI